MVDGCHGGQHFRYSKAERCHLIAGSKGHVRPVHSVGSRWSFQRTGPIGATRGHEVPHHERKQGSVVFTKRS
jgi:hypothetical protein